MKKKKLLFGKRNYKFMLIGLSFIALGFILMSGGGSEDPNVFNEEIEHSVQVEADNTQEAKEKLLIKK